MGASDLPYQLRPNKFIDRQLFLELLRRVVPAIGPEKYCYISMGGKHLVDHHEVYRSIGIRHLYSFDFDEVVVARQRVNVPRDMMVCSQMHSSDLPANIESILSNFDGAERSIVWLDYTDPKERFSQMQEFCELLRAAVPGDIVRITQNAKIYNVDNWKVEGAKSIASYRAKLLRDSLGDYYPSGVTEVIEGDICKVLAQAISIAASSASSTRKDLEFVPLLLTSYRDGSPMFTATVLVSDGSIDLEGALGSWDFKAQDWATVFDIYAPELSVKEKIILDECISKSAPDIIKEIPFQLDKSEFASLKVINSYKKLHRYYPTFKQINY